MADDTEDLREARERALRRADRQRERNLPRDEDEHVLQWARGMAAAERHDGWEQGHSSDRIAGEPVASDRVEISPTRLVHAVSTWGGSALCGVTKERARTREDRGFDSGDKLIDTGRDWLRATDKFEGVSCPACLREAIKRLYTRLLEIGKCDDFEDLGDALVGALQAAKP